MAGQVLKVHLTSRMFDYSSLLEYSKEVPTGGIIPSQLVEEYGVEKQVIVEIPPPSKGIQDAILRVGDAYKTSYFTTIEKVRAAAWNYMDETGIRVIGKNYWLWTFRTPEDEVVLVIRPSRGRAFCMKFLVRNSTVQVSSVAGEPIISFLFYSATGCT
mgnify:CR=1 FL=1